MGRLTRKIGDRRLLRLIRRYLGAGVMDGGVVVDRHEGTPQGGPLSPLLANVLLDEVDKELERRGHSFVRYADDHRVFVGSRRAGERVIRSLGVLFGKLRLQINQTKSAVDRVWYRPFLGFSFWTAPGMITRVKASKQSLVRMKDRVRQLTRRSGGRSLVQVVQSLRRYQLGWRNYFRLAGMARSFSRLDEWIRHRLRNSKPSQSWRIPFLKIMWVSVQLTFSLFPQPPSKYCSFWWFCATAVVRLSISK